MPLRAFVAGLFFSFMFSMPPSLKAPDFFTCSTATPMNASTTPFTPSSSILLSRPPTGTLQSASS